MEINFVDKSQKQGWNVFVVQNKGSFLQSFEWGKFQELVGNKVFRIQAKEGSQILAQALVVEHKFPSFNKSYFYIPYGPCFTNEKALELLFQDIKKLSKQYGTIFLRVEPITKLAETAKKAQRRIQPQKTLVLDIRKSEDEILQGFPKGTRYSIRQAEKKGVSVEFRDEYTPEFYQLMNKTSDRSNFTPHSEKYYKGFFASTSEDFKVKMCLVKHQEKIISASMMILFNKRATYLHATSDKEFNSMQGPTFLMWEQIKLAKRMGCETFDFWGIDEKKWPGVTSFKKSFGGKEIEYPQGMDISYKKIWYLVYKIAKKIKNKEMKR